MPLMTAQQFKSRSSKFLGRRSNPIILDIDNLLAAYHASQDNPRRQIKILVLLYVWCKQYIAGGGTRRGIDDLLEAVTLELQDPRRELQMRLAHQGARWADGQLQVSETKGKAMGTGYGMEPYLPGKGSVGGLRLQHQQKRFNTPAMRVIFEDQITEGLDRSGAQYTMASVVHQAEQAMANASIPEFLDAFVEFSNSPAAAQREDFEYCTTSTREQYRVYVNPASGRFYRDQLMSKVYSSEIPGNALGSWGLYVFDMSHRLYVKPATAARDGAFNHSSFLSGRPVACAGAIEVSAGGFLKDVSNESGHYRPTAGDLAYMCGVLCHEYGVNLTSATVTLKTANGKQTSNAMAFYNAHLGSPRSKLTDF